MKITKLNEMSTGELLKKEKSLKAVTYVGIAVMAIAAVIYWYLSTKRGVGPLSFLPVIMIPVIMLNLKAIKEVRKEINSRNG